MREEELASRIRHAEVAESAGILPLDTCLGDWRLTAFLARGGAADVYCAEHVTLGTSAAVKVLREKQPGLRGGGVLAADSRCERFHREAKILSELKSPSFPRFYAYGTCDGHDYLIEELLEPRELPKGSRTATRFLFSLCSAVGELHARGLVHCDIKPANILFRPGSGEPVLVDLGLAASATEGSSGGTPGFSAPEQFLGGEVTPSADIHALGVLAERLGLRWKGVIRRATSSIPTERYKTVTEFVQAILRRQWVCRVLGAVALLLGAFVVVAAIISGITSDVPDEIVLEGRTLVLSEPLSIPSGKTVRVIGPGTLDAEITGGEGSCLWMTNCVVIHRAKKVFPAVPVCYELTRGVYLNFINADMPPSVGKHVYISDGAYNAVRFRGPRTIAELKQLRLKEAQADNDL